MKRISYLFKKRVHAPPLDPRNEFACLTPPGPPVLARPKNGGRSRCSLKNSFQFSPQVLFYPELLSRYRFTGAFTLVELIVVVICAIIILAPVMRIFQAGTRSSYKGMLQIETAQEARRILRQIHNDLKSSCFVQKEEKHKIDFSLMMTTGGTVIAPLFSFVAFPFQGETDFALPERNEGMALRRASRITYSLEPGKGERGLGKLWRHEQFHPDHPMAAMYPPGGVQERVLSNRVNFFAIEPFAIESNGEIQHLFWVSLKIVDAFQPTVAESKLLSVTEKPGEFLLKRSRGLVITSFHDVVASDFFNACWNHGEIRRNWHTGAAAP